MCFSPNHADFGIVSRVNTATPIKQTRDYVLSIRPSPLCDGRTFSSQKCVSFVMGP